jgi:hypothetical protein
MFGVRPISQAAMFVQGDAPKHEAEDTTIMRTLTPFDRIGRADNRRAGAATHDL